MISTTNFRDTANITTNHRTDRDAVERTAAAALRHGSRVTITVETRTSRNLVCSVRPMPGAYYLRTERGSVELPSISEALATGLRRFDEAFGDVFWPRAGRDD